MNIHSAMQKAGYGEAIRAVSAFVADDPGKLAQVMEILFGPDDAMANKAAWVAGQCLEAHPELAPPYLDDLMGLATTTCVDGIMRNVIRAFSLFPALPEACHGPMMTKCFDLLADPKVAVAIQVHAMTVLHRLSKTYPEIKGELHLILQENYARGSAGYRSRAGKILKGTLKVPGYRHLQ